jgi:hypothetical protein
VAADLRRQPFRVCDQREDVSVREEIAKGFEDLLPSAHPDEPIVYQCDLQERLHGSD